MIVLDTNVLSELMRPAPDPGVEAWLADQPPARVFLTAITEAELRYGAALLPAGKRHSAILAEIDALTSTDFAGRILPFDRDAARDYADIAAARRAAGRPISQADCQIAAIVRSRGALLATRNSGDFAECGIEVVNPWNAAKK